MQKEKRFCSVCKKEKELDCFNIMSGYMLKQCKECLRMKAILKRNPHKKDELVIIKKTSKKLRKLEIASKIKKYFEERSNKCKK